MNEEPTISNSPIAKLNFTGLTDSELLVLFVDSKSEAAFEELVSRHSNLVLKICRATVWDQACVDDAFQATFLSVVRNARRLRNANSFSGWICRVARHAAIKASKRHRGQEDQMPLSAADEICTELDPLSHIAAQEAVRSLSEELDSIPLRYREALTLFYFEQLSRSQIANRMNASEIAVKSLLQRGKKLLRSRLMRRGIAPSMVMIGMNTLCGVNQAQACSQLITKTVAVCSGTSSATTASPLDPSLSSAAIVTDSKFLLAAYLGIGIALTSALLIRASSFETGDGNVANLNVIEFEMDLDTESDSPAALVEIEKLEIEKPTSSNESASIEVSKEEAPKDPANGLASSTLVQNIELRTDHRVEPIVQPISPMRADHRVEPIAQPSSQMRTDHRVDNSNTNTNGFENHH